MEETQSNTSSSRGFNPLPIVAVVILVGVVGWMMLAGRNKTTTSKESAPAASQQAQATDAPKPTENAVAGVSTAPTQQDIKVEGGSFYFKPNEIKVKKGDKVTVTFTNAGGLHDFVIDELNVKTKRLNAGQTEVVEFTPDKTGTFEFYCSVGNHRQMGMKGNLIVE
jgi:plastocyanin